MNYLRIIASIVIVLLLTRAGSAGTKDAIYLQEGFNGTGLPAGWSQIRISGIQAAWNTIGQGSNPSVPPYAGAGQVKFNSYDAGWGEQARLTSPAINLTSSIDPFLTFWMYHEDEYLAAFDSLYVEASTTDSIAGPWTTLAGVRRPQSNNRWVKEVISLYPYRGTNRLFLSLRGVSKYGNNIFADELRVADSTFHDIGTVGLLFPGQQLAESASSPSRNEATSSRTRSRKVEIRDIASSPLVVRATAYSPLTIGAIIRNFGTFAENSYSLSWRIDAQLQTPVSGRLIAARTGRDTLTLTWTTPVAGTYTLTAWTALSTDLTRTNDTTQMTIQVIDTATVFFESFNGAQFPPANWVVINRDGGALEPWYRGADTSAFVPFEGSGFAANNFQRANIRYIDDYLITPPIAGVGQQQGRNDSLIFWVRSKFNTPPPSQNYPDSLMIALSTSGVDTSNFTVLVDYFEIPKTGWTRKAYQLSGRVPANSSVRIAFRYLLFDAGTNGSSGDFIGVDAVQVVRKLPTAVDAREPVPARFALDQNYPNPFNPQTSISMTIPQSGDVSLKVFDLLGREIATLVNDRRDAGKHTFAFDASRLSSGVYYYRLQFGSRLETKKMIVLR